MPSLSSFLPCERPGVSFSHDERGLAAVAELGVDGGDDDGDVGDAAVGDEDLGAVEDPLVAVELRGGAQRLDVGAGAGLGDRVGAELDLVAEAVALGHPPADLLGRAGRGDAGGGERGGGDRERDAGAAPVQLLGVDDAVQAARSRWPCSGGSSMPWRLPLARLRMTSHGTLCSRSYLAATGRMTSSAKRWHCPGTRVARRQAEVHRAQCTEVCCPANEIVAAGQAGHRDDHPLPRLPRLVMPWRGV